MPQRCIFDLWQCRESCDQKRNHRLDGPQTPTGAPAKKTQDKKPIRPAQLLREQTHSKFNPEHIRKSCRQQKQSASLTYLGIKPFKRNYDVHGKVPKPPRPKINEKEFHSFNLLPQPSHSQGPATLSFPQ